MTMLEIMKERLPEGLEIKKVQNRSNANQIKIWFTYEGLEVIGYLPTTCIPGAAEKVADFTISAAMMEAHMRKGDIEGARAWMVKQNTLVGME